MSYTTRRVSRPTNRAGYYGNFRRAPKKASNFDPSLLVRQATEAVLESFVPQHNFSDFALHPKIQANIEAKGYTQPTEIQDKVIREVLMGKDVVGVANTGTGKTAAFLIPLIQKIMDKPNERVLIVAPTRELAEQINDEFRQLARYLNMFSCVCIGGVGMMPQMRALSRSPQFVIGTPGRLIDLERRNVLQFMRFSTIVLDEVDQMLDMGFIHDITHIVSALPAKRHTLFFSATLPAKAQEVMRKFLMNPVLVSVKKQDTAALVNQDVVKLNGRIKIDVLHELLLLDNFSKVLVFVRTKHSTDRIARNLQDRGLSVAAIHGNKNQSQRRRALDMFKSERVRVLLATDVASRGLDISDVTHVINYDLPETYEDYIHRIGRTGRANKQGIALTLVD